MGYHGKFGSQRGNAGAALGGLCSGCASQVFCCIHCVPPPQKKIRALTGSNKSIDCPLHSEQSIAVSVCARCICFSLSPPSQPNTPPHRFY